MTTVPARERGLYHGWKVVIALFLAGMMVYGCGLYSFTLFITPLTAEFGWSRAATSGLVSAFWLAAPLTLAGDPIIRRFGGFRMIAAGVVIASLTLIAIGTCKSLIMLYALRLVMGVGKVLMACGVSILAAQWFSRSYGMAIATCYAGWHFGGLTMVPLTQMLIDHVGWRTTAMILGVAISAVTLPPLWLWTRVPSPAERGEIPEIGGRLPLSVDTPRAGAAPALGTVMAQPIVWWSMGVTMLGAVAYGAIITNEAALVDELAALRGLGHGLGAGAVSLTAVTALIGALVFGWAADRLPPLLLSTVDLLLMIAGAMGFVLVARGGGPLVIDLSAIAFGLAVGGFEPVVVPHMKKCLPQQWFGHAYGTWYLGYLGVLFAAPIGLGWLHDVTGSYLTALECALVPVLLAFVPAVLAARVKALV